MEIAITFGIIAVIVVIFAIIWRIDSRRARERAEAFRAVAKQMGLTFELLGDTALLATIQRFGLGGKGRTPRLVNLVRGIIDGVHVAVFDFDYTVGPQVTSAEPGQQAQAIGQTVVLVESPEARIPGFALTPRNFLHRLGSLLGMHELQFDSHPDFSKKYVLRALDEAAVRRLFSADVLVEFEKSGGMTVEAAGTTMLLYCDGQLLKAEDVPAAIQQGLKTFALVQRAPALG